MSELSPRFNFKEAEEKWLKAWNEKNIFHAKAPADRVQNVRGSAEAKKPYSIVIPPPNVTGILHMGHALNNTLQDIMIRYKRMNGFEACWMVGTDHAGIATQNVVEKELAKEGKTRHTIGREKMLERLWAWKNQYGNTIINQLTKLGSSCDWARTRFTMDQDYSEAVQAVFIRLYEEDLIYRGKRIINWCPRCQTALSDEEAEHKETQGHLYHIRYPFKNDPQKFVTVATTRPETMLGDTAVAVNPKDERYQTIIGQTLILPLVNREIKIITDELIDPAFGTGAVKVTPAHDPNDFVMGTRHQLNFINVMDPDGKINTEGGPFAGLDRFEARKKVIESLKDNGLLEKVEPHTHAVGHCYRCNTVVEPYLSWQWFVRMKPLAEPALKAVQTGEIKFYPERWTKVYTNWMEGIHDWCISRQIWWGHQIPVWYHGEHHVAARNNDEAIIKLKAKYEKEGVKPPPNITPQQDPDVLDTWFSSWLWPFATFGWPKEAESGKRGASNAQSEASNVQRPTSSDLNYFYPTNSLFTASEIIFFWVARMIMAGYHFMGQKPFSDVYIHGTVRDAKGRKMSKSLGNAIDPLEIINEYGADALRFSLILNSGQDLFISKEKFEVGRNFANKIWNASRLVLMNVKTKDRTLTPNDLASKWIVSKFYATLKDVNAAIEGYRFSEAENLIYEFFWKNYCDWYLEIIKNQWADENIQKTAFFILSESVKMMHPFMPFVTEELWASFGIGERMLSIEKWPEIKTGLIDAEAEKQMDTVLELVGAIRNTRSQWGIKPNETIECHFAAAEKAGAHILKETGETLKFLLKLKDLNIHDQLPKTKDSAAGVVGSIKYSVVLGGLVDIAAEKAKMAKEIEASEKNIEATQSRLNNEAFVAKAPADIIAKEREKIELLSKKVKELKDVLKNLQ